VFVSKQGIVTLILMVVAVFLLMYTCRGRDDKKKDDTGRTAEPISEKGTKGNSLAWRVYSKDYIRPEPASLGSLDPDSGYKMKLDISSTGCSIDKLLLNEHFETVEDKAAFDACGREVSKYLQQVRKDDDLQGFYSLLSPVANANSLASEWLKIERSSDGKVAGGGELGVRNWKKVDEKTDENGISRSVTYKFSVLDNEGKNERLSIFKTYTLENDSYSIGIEIRIENHTDHKLYVDLQTAGPAGMNREGTRRDFRYVAVGRSKGGMIEAQMPRDYNKLESEKTGEDGNGQWESLGSEEGGSNNVAWIGIINKYFGAFLYPEPEDKTDLRAAGLGPEYFIRPVKYGDDRMAWKIALQTKGLVVSARKDCRVNIDFFAGPKKRELFDKNELYSRLRYVDTVSTRGCFCAWDWLRSGLMKLLGIFASYLFLGNYGLAIVLLVAVVRVILHPLAKRGQVNMAKTQKKMNKLKPEIEKVKKKYADNRQEMNREMMKIYKEHGNPMSGMILGCLPMLLQMPIWIALFTGLNSNVALRHEGLLPVWLTDLSAPDFLIDFHASFNIPLISSLMGPITGFNLLPILLCVSMYLHSKYGATSQAPQETATPEQLTQQKMMRVMMPVMMLLFFYNAPSGLTLYIMASTTVGLIESHYIKKHIKEDEEKKAAAETVVKISGKGPRRSRPKKPRGPFQK